MRVRPVSVYGDKNRNGEIYFDIYNIYKKSFAVTDIANTLFKIKHEINRADYVKQIAKTLKIATTALKAEIGKFEIAAAEEEKKQKEKDGTLYSTRNLKLPKGGNMEEYLEHGFLTIGNQFHFPINGQFIEGTDWKFEPLFQIMGDKENKRLAEITNTANQKKIIEFDSEILSSFGEFRRFLFKLNGFLFYTDNGIKTEHFDRFVRRYNRQFQPASELLTMGQNPKNFYAFANGVYWQDKFRPVNKFGIMNLKGIDTSDGEYNEKIDNYYSPAFSVMHKDNQVGDDKYENDRYFVYKESPITLNDWMDKMQLVFDEKETVETEQLTDGLRNGATTEVLNQTDLLPLTDDLFDNDALIFNDLKSSSVSLQKGGEKKWTFNFEEFPYLGIWSKSSESPFVCIEPWFGVADSTTHNQNFVEKEGIIKLEPSEIFDCNYSIEIH